MYMLSGLFSKLVFLLKPSNWSSIHILWINRIFKWSLIIKITKSSLILGSFGNLIATSGTLDCSRWRCWAGRGISCHGRSWSSRRGRCGRNPRTMSGYLWGEHAINVLAFVYVSIIWCVCVCAEPRPQAPHRSVRNDRYRGAAGMGGFSIDRPKPAMVHHWRCAKSVGAP